MPEYDLAILRSAVQQDRYITTRHAKYRMGLRQVTDEDLKAVIVNGSVIEQYPEAKPFPKVLFMQHVHSEPLYVVCAFDGTCAYIITVHRYDPTIWIDPWTRRKNL
ncbi:MAG: DUF4258 domain-containing protein [Acidobacteriota bacterium]|nr:DUF4258 domain-containing protein [Acidobacteriota bacterium]